MWDIATPLMVGGHHVGNVFMGQFFFDDEQLDRALFEAQAARYGFDREMYLAALDAVPRLSRETVAGGMAFFLRLSAMLSKLSYSNIKLARSVTEREALMSSLQESKERLEEADRRKDEFLGMLSHELRNPLAPIRNSHLHPQPRRPDRRAGPPRQGGHRAAGRAPDAPRGRPPRRDAHRAWQDRAAT